MSLKLIAPGTRGNKYYYVRGSLNGQRYEFSTQTTDKASAERLKAEFELRALTDAGINREPTFKYAAEQYLAWRKPSLRDEKQALLLIDVLGSKLVRQVVQADLVRAADIILPGAKPANQNRWVIRIGAAILHYAAQNKWCEWQRIQLLKEPKPVTRTTTLEVASKLVQAAPTPLKKLFLLWLFKHGDRVTDATNVAWEDIDLTKGFYRIYVRKTDEWRKALLDTEVLSVLIKLASSLGEDKPHYVFPWRSRHSIYNWLQPLTEQLGVKFTPHMARHTVGTMLQAAGTSQRTIMERLGHADMKSSMRYQGSDMEALRKANALLPTFLKSGD